MVIGQNAASSSEIFHGSSSSIRVVNAAGDRSGPSGLFISSVSVWSRPVPWSSGTKGFGFCLRFCPVP